MNRKQARIALIVKMSGKCSQCSEADITKLETHHTKRIITAKGNPLIELQQFMRTGQIPDGIEVLCKKCNNKRRRI